MEPILLARVTRSGVTESVHYGSVVVADADGNVRAALGNPERRCYLRSSAKPLQAILVVTSGAAERFSLTDEELAIACASHSGSARHVEVVRNLLAKLGLEPEALQCGTHEVSDSEERRRLCREGLKPSPLHNNCSGKHAGMLATALAWGLPIEDYIRPEHPLQQAHLKNIALFCKMEAQDIAVGVDGCGVATFAVPLRAAATAYARLATGNGLSEEVARAARRVVEAMWAAPDMISAPGAFNSELLAACQGLLVGKGGAEGLFCVGAAGSGEGIAIKTEDGSSRGLSEALLAAITARWPFLPCSALERWRVTPVYNARGEQVGQVESLLPTEAIAASRA
jgi:L-asparaginase II